MNCFGEALAMRNNSEKFEIILRGSLGTSIRASAILRRKLHVLPLFYLH